MRQLACLILLIFAWAAPASAHVQIRFYSKDLASTFPHAFIALSGTVDSTGEQVDANYGFTPARLTPKILTGAVPGMIQTLGPRYIARSDLQFALDLTDNQYRTVMLVVDKWWTLPQPSYRLRSRNCVSFVADVASALGLSAPPYPPLMFKPKGFLRQVARDNAVLIEQWPTRFAATPLVGAPPAAAAEQAAK